MENQPKLPTKDDTTLIYYHFNDTVGAIFLGIASLFLLSALLRSNRRYRKLLEEKQKGEGNTR